MNTFFDLSSKSVIVTGGGSGIGKAIAQLFAKQQANVYVFEINEEQARQCVDDIVKEGGQARAMKCDVTNHTDVKKVVGEVFSLAGHIDILVNNAGIAHVGTIASTSEGDFDKVFKVNVKGFYNTMHAVIDCMEKQGSGVILNMASIACSSGIPDRFAYSMSKGAVQAMTLSVARDFVRKNIRCNCISPARVHTPFVDGFLKTNYPGREAEMFEKLSQSQPIGRMGKPEEVAMLALYLCSDEASFITGCDYLIDGGFVNLAM